MDISSSNNDWAFKFFKSPVYGWVCGVFTPWGFVDYNQKFGGEFWLRRGDKSRYFLRRKGAGK